MSDLPSGQYDVGISSGVMLYLAFAEQIFSGVLGRTGTSILHVNSIDSPFGAGWGLDGLQHLIENPDGSLLLIDGNGSEALYENPERIVRDLLIPDHFNAGGTAVARFDGVTGEFLGHFVESGAGGLTSAHNPTFGPDGNLYVISGTPNTSTIQILRYDGQTGEFLDVFVDAGQGGFAGASRLTFGPDGVLYAATSNIGQGVLRYDMEGNFLGAIAGPAQGVQWACGIAFGADGLLYVWDTFDEEMRRFDPTTGELIDIFIPSGNLVNACEFAFGTNGDIFITDATFNQIRRFSGVDGSFMGVFASTGAPTSGITYGPDGNFYVNVAGNTHRFDGQTGAFIDVFVPNLGGFINFFPGTTSQGATVYTSHSGDFRVMERLADGTYQRTTPDQMVTRFDTEGRIVSESDRNGNVTSYVYDAGGKLERIIDPVGLETAFAYDNGRVSSITDPAGRVTTLAYDTAGNLIQITDPDGSTRQFTYDAQHRMTGEVDQRGNSEQTVYDAHGRVDRVIRKDLSVVDFGLAQVQGLYSAELTSNPFTAPQASADPLGRTTVIDGNGNQVTRRLDNAGRLIEQSDAIGPLLTLGRDPDTRLITSWIDARGNVTLFTYDDAGNIIGIEDAISAGQGQSFTYDRMFHQVTSFTDELGRQTLFNIDPSNGNVRSITQVVGALGGGDDVVTQFTYTPRGLVETRIDPLGRVTHWSYDALGRVITVTLAQGTADEVSRHFEYDPAGNVTAYINENGARTEFVYDAMNRLVRITEADPDGAGPLASPVIEYAYDAAGNLVAMVDPRGNTTLYEYDAMNRLTRVADAQGNERRYVYDDSGNLVSYFDPNGHQTRYVYDARNRLVEQIDDNGGQTFYAYDLDDNLTSRIDPVGNETLWTYDERSRVVSMIDPRGATSTYVYDLFDNLIGMTDRNGRTTEFEYDDVNRLIGEIWVGSGNQLQFTYDLAGNLLTTVDNFSSLTFAYDALNRLTSVDNLGTPHVPRVVLNYSYDEVGNLVTLSDTIDGQPAGTNSSSYDALNRLISLTQTGINVTDKRVDFAYNPRGEFESLARFADSAATQSIVESTFDFDSLNRLVSLVHTGPSGPLAFPELVYDAASRIAQRANVGGTTLYEYDSRNQLLAATHSNPLVPNESYVYDAAGNRTGSHLHAAYTTGPGNQLLSDGTYNYQYDDEGNLVRRTEIATGALREFEWDHRNRLIAVIDRDGATNDLQRVEFTYDPFDRRIRTTFSSPSDDWAAHFVYHDDDVLLEFADADGIGGPNPLVLSQRYLHGPAIDQLLAQDDGAGNVFWHLEDHLRTTIGLVDNAGGLAQQLSYDSFGNLLHQTGDPLPRYLFTGREHDIVLGLYYLRSRYMDPQTGLYLSAGSDDATGFYNAYRYAMNNPLRYRQPFGRG